MDFLLFCWGFLVVCFYCFCLFVFKWISGGLQSRVVNEYSSHWDILKIISLNLRLTCPLMNWFFQHVLEPYMCYFPSESDLIYTNQGYLFSKAIVVVFLRRGGIRFCSFINSHLSKVSEAAGLGTCQSYTFLLVQSLFRMKLKTGWSLFGLLDAVRLSRCP